MNIITTPHAKKKELDFDNTFIYHTISIPLSSQQEQQEKQQQKNEKVDGMILSYINNGYSKIVTKLSFQIYICICVYTIKKKGRQHLFYVSKYTSSLVEYNSLLYYLLYKHKCESQRSCCFFFVFFFNSFEMIRALFLQEDTWKWSFWSYNKNLFSIHNTFYRNDGDILKILYTNYNFAKLHTTTILQLPVKSICSQIIYFQQQYFLVQKTSNFK